MASQLQIEPAEYLSTSFEGVDREYVRGEIIERGMPTYPHGKTQGELFYHFRHLRDSHRLFACTETRMRLASDLYRIPDVAVFAGTEPDEEVPSHPPLLVVEIISPDDRYSEVQEKLSEYQQWGVPHIWVVDPHRRTLATYDAGALLPASSLALPGYPLEFSSNLFS
jgi:Uma2 family endonuclease